jgi:hypothetical protein
MRIRTTLLIATALLTLGCSRGTAAGISGEVEVLRRGAAAAPEGTTARELLLQKVKMPPAHRALRDAVRLDSTGSGASSDLTYHWARVQGRNSHDFEVVAIGRYGGQFFEPADLAGWDAVFDAWAPRSPDEAWAVCSEAVAVGVNNNPSRLTQRDLLEVGSARRLVRPSERDLIGRSYRPRAVELTHGADGRWNVRFWYPHLEQSPYEGRLATEYKCEISPDLGGGFRVLETDSILVRR